MKFHRDLITVQAAAKILGVQPRRVQAMIAQACPDCGKSGRLESGMVCARCHGQGRYLPAVRFGEAANSPWMIIRRDLELVADRRVGRPPIK